MEYRSRKEEKFDNIYRLYANDIYRVCLHFTQNKDLAQDITQQVFVDFYDYFETVNPECVFAYLVRAVRNLVCSMGIDVNREMGAERSCEESHPDKVASEGDCTVD